MAANNGERTLISAIYLPGTCHVNGVFAIAVPNMAQSARTLIQCAASASSLIADFTVRAAPKSGIYQGVFERLPLIAAGRYFGALALRVSRLNLLTKDYTDLRSAERSVGKESRKQR